MSSTLVYHHQSAVRLWLAACLLLVALMVLVGGYTRLSGSGLSITEWKPIHGAIPPLSLEQWEEEFDSYKASPQYQKVNKGMSLDEFKTIFWPEFLHRLLGRAIGIVFFIPLVFFSLKRAISGRFSMRLLFIFMLGGVQGGVGWLMVASGLIDTPYVSHIKLALHLSIAFLIFALLLWALLDVKRAAHNPAPQSVLWSFKLWFAALCVQIVLGAFVAGLHGGLIYNTWPSMNGQFIPDGLFSMPSLVDNVLLNLTLIQFMHRKLAFLVVFGFYLWWFFTQKFARNSQVNKVALAIAAIVALQFLLGVITLLNQAPLDLALAHQMMALVLFGLATAQLHALTGK